MTFRPVTIEDTRVVTHEAGTTNSVSVGSSVGDAALRDFLSSLEEELSAGRASGIWFGREEATALRSLLARLATAETALADRDRHFQWDDRLRMEREIGDLATRLATAEAERDRLRAVEAHRAEILNALAYCSHERILDLLDFSGFQLESLTEAEEQRAAFKAAGIALSGLLRAPSTGTTPP